jgi:hypothetical protein
MILRSTTFDSRHRWQLRSQRTQPRQACRTAFLCRCRWIRIQFGSSSPLCCSPEPFQLGEQFTDAFTGCLVFMKCLCAVPKTFSKKLSLIPQKLSQFPAYLGNSFVLPWNIPIAHDLYSRRLENTYNRGKHLFCGVKKVEVSSNRCR